MTMFLDLCATLMRCTVHLKPVTFETFGAALEPAPQGFEENEKMIEPLGENCHTVRGTCVVIVALVDTTHKTK